MLAALARALRLSAAETGHLFALAGVARPGPGRISDVVRPSVLRLLDRMQDLPAMIVDARGDILAWNDLSAAVLGDLSAVPRRRRTHLWLHFVTEETFTSRLVTDDGSGPRLDRSTVALARAALARCPDEAPLRRTVAELRAHVPRFAALWDERPIEHRYSEVRRLLRHARQPGRRQARPAPRGRPADDVSAHTVRVPADAPALPRTRPGRRR